MSSRQARFRVAGTPLDSSGGPQCGTVTIDRDTGIILVRPLRRRRVYQLTLAQVATYVCRTNILAELRAKKAEKKAEKKARRKSR